MTQDSNFPISDSPNANAFETIVELYYQLQGYITSSGKWFRVPSQEKRYSGYQDIDVLAVGENETIFVSATTNLDDKIRIDQAENVNTKMLDNLKRFFNRVSCYLRDVNEYRWLITKDRTVKKTLAHFGRKTDCAEPLAAILQAEGIDVLSAEEMIQTILQYLDENRGLKIQDPTLRLLHFLKFTYPEALAHQDPKE